ncbi:hypothetical protein ACFFX0_28820 [Citricoccus parietis]|uniref:Uncharacterized protein n=1 Tax=Citricoccus parietis TaxID=592307 RepID=A0ABV5G7E4_9MICC
MSRRNSTTEGSSRWTRGVTHGSPGSSRTGRAPVERWLSFIRMMLPGL